VELTDTPRDEDVASLEAHIDQHNMAVTGRRDYRPLGVFERDPRSGDIVAGLAGFTWGDWLEIKFVWVRPGHRGRGLGRRLVETAEAEARARGCHSAWLDSYTFQAPGMYEKLGYRAFGRLQNYPDHAERVFLTRSLAAAAPGARENQK
jgi:ribosomal protein S18 acetylase RimI-like enzyme